MHLNGLGVRSMYKMFDALCAFPSVALRKAGRELNTRNAECRWNVENGLYATLIQFWVSATYDGFSTDRPAGR